MDTEQFDRFAVALSRRSPRRSFLGLLAALGLTGLVGGEVAAQACLADGERCGRATDPACCSGWCKRKHGSDKTFCKAAPDQGTCTVAQDDCGGSDTCNGDPKCPCFVSTRGASFRGAGVDTGLNWDCVVCERDRDCEKVTGKGSRCIPCGASRQPGPNLCAEPGPTQV